ncbi:MAG: TerC/Alx family metal homeostasis membrane protein [Bacteroidales bacterium]|jgi:tellurite resistance protein TerC|nr:TerC/Alx family metal homeostasis membrane protein [Bacteroidales bacterium]
MLVWIIFIAAILIFMVIDLGIFNRQAHVISMKEATAWTITWICIALSFSGIVYLLYKNNLVSNIDDLSPRSAVIKYITGYLIELSLSIDNIFVIAVIFTTFNIPMKYQHRVLFWGILGAIVFRLLMILFGVMLIHRIDWIIYVFGAFLLFTGINMYLKRNRESDFRRSPIYRFVNRIFPVTSGLKGQRFFIRYKGKIILTPLMVALMVIEATDVLFAVDSVPAILAITSDPFLVFSSNILAILGLRSLYFFLSNMLDRFRNLKYSLIVILLYVGIKMILSHHTIIGKYDIYIDFPEWFSLSFIIAAMLAGILSSIRRDRENKA